MASESAAAQSNGSPEKQQYSDEQHQPMMANDIKGLQQQDDAEYGDEEGAPGQMMVS